MKVLHISEEIAKRIIFYVRHSKKYGPENRDGIWLCTVGSTHLQGSDQSQKRHIFPGIPYNVPWFLSDQQNSNNLSIPVFYIPTEFIETRFVHSMELSYKTESFLSEILSEQNTLPRSTAEEEGGITINWKQLDYRYSFSSRTVLEQDSAEPATLGWLWISVPVVTVQDTIALGARCK